MVKSLNSFDEFKARLSKSGHICFGALRIDDEHCAKGCEEFIGQPALLIGNAGQQMWEEFSKSDDFGDGKTDPMNCWTHRVLDALAQEIEVRAVYPFDEPYWPFQRLAQKVAGVKPSPLGILIHPEYGLWHAFRGLFILDETHVFMSQINGMLENPDKSIHACDTCEDKPCLTACPVGAFTGEQLIVKSCFEHLDSGIEPDCMGHGCRARSACPIGAAYKYKREQRQFHMSSYRGKS